ncbi:Neprilysin-3 [Nymphon striatum]|nr:Neprilysin-3 [Nymphon striatum]
MVLTSRIEQENSTSLAFNIFEGLPELVEDVYFNDSNPHYKKVKAAYKNLMESSLKILHPSKTVNTSKVLNHINAFEQAHVFLLQYTYSKANEVNTTNVSEMSIANFSKTYPQMNWSKILDTIEKTLDISPLPREQIIIKVWNHNYMYGLMKIIEKAGPEVLLDFVMWRFFLKFMPYLTDDFYKLYKEYIEKVGLDQTNPFQLHMSSRRWKFCLDIVSTKLPIVMTASYTKTHFLFEQTSSQVREMIPKFEEAFNSRVKNATWLSKDSKTKILEKVEHTIWKLASPEIVKNEQEVNTLHSLLSINSSLLLENLMEIIVYQSKENIELAENNYMRTSGSNPLVVNAFHATELNAIAIPMGVMSQPLLEKNRPSYLNYAGLGTLIGHEFMHGFNHMGITFDHEGSSNGSLTSEDDEKFQKMLQCFVDQYTEYVYGGKQIDGNYTLGENVCDSEGLELSLQAYRLSSKNEKNHSILPGLDMAIDQIFFLQHAQIWCEVLSHKGYRLYSKDSHSPGKYRVIGAVKNSKSFSEAYKCAPEANMNPDKKMYSMDVMIHTLIF